MARRTSPSVLDGVAADGWRGSGDTGSTSPPLTGLSVRRCQILSAGRQPGPLLRGPSLLDKLRRRVGPKVPEHAAAPARPEPADVPVPGPRHRRSGHRQAAHGGRHLAGAVGRAADRGRADPCADGARSTRPGRPLDRLPAGGGRVRPRLLQPLEQRLAGRHWRDRDPDAPRHRADRRALGEGAPLAPRGVAHRRACWSRWCWRSSSAPAC